jgi:hypothetical protein
VRQVHALEHEMNGRERLHFDPAGPQFGVDLGKRNAGLGIDQRSQQFLMRLEYGTAMAADALWDHRACLAQPPHQLHGGRGTDLIADSRLADRAALLNGANDAPAQVLGQRCGHGEPLCSRP